MNKLEKTINEIQVYFINKIKGGDISPVSSDPFSFCFKIDNKYYFTFWMCNGSSFCTQTNHFAFASNNFMDLSLEDTRDKEKIYNILQPLYLEQQKEQNASTDVNYLPF